MGKRKDLIPRKRGQITVLLKVSDLKQKDTAKDLHAPTLTASTVRKELEVEREMDSLRIGKCGRKRKTRPRLDRKIRVMALASRRASRTFFGIGKREYYGGQENHQKRHFEQGLKAYRPRKKASINTENQAAEI